MQLTIIFYPNLRVVKSLQEKISWNLEYHAKRPWNLNHSLIVNFLIKIIKINKKEIKHRSCDYANLGTQVDTRTSVSESRRPQLYFRELTETPLHAHKPTAYEKSNKQSNH